MRITMICIGSTGDVRPYLVLGRELRRRGHEVSICAFATFESAVRAEGLGFRPVSGDVKTFMANLMNGANGVAFLKQVRDTMREFIEPFLADLEAATEGAQAIIGTYFGQVFQSLAEMRRVPYVQTHYFPIDPNPQAPIASAPGQRVGKAWNLATYQLGHLLISTLEKYYLSDWRQSRGMSPRKLEAAPSYELCGHLIPVLYAISPLIMPRPARWGENIHMTGFWLDRRESSYQPDPALDDFLAAGEKPVYIGFGSMNAGDMAETLDIVREAVRESGVRAVLSTGWGGVTVPPEENLYVAGFVPHDWLFDRVSAVVHHGGAGTTAAGITAGRPTLVVPFGGDQPFWATRVKALGLGPHAIPRDRLTAPRLARALTDLTETPKYRVAARELGERLRLEQGEVIAANIIEHELRKWLREEGLPPDPALEQNRPAPPGPAASAPAG
ncbi:MAG TPA: glycosyltransferase family 1 protein [Candidatus Limiplasma pullistercoris]|nr:glycosyltransferase family 1 protein [Candidatus Limiplasma pullistercoris]